MTVSPESTTEQELLDFLHSRTKKVWQEDADLFASGGLSSLFAMELVVHLEKSYGVSVRGKDLKLDNFRTVRSMVSLVRRLQGAYGDAGE
ncbi:acyl carrier protein [Streptomyces sp. 11-1-2]|uniref:acyl carrier protein n=1 Tax=unclassified Streptomyces TaxID=2593676 RepID=UPI000B8D40A4|nr:acyl carrier protein [Streptomyces sp. 11-1-2]ASQ93337.1 methoxymalonate biosynthesis protein [Streptomyces sp. 11-1-2]